MSIIFEGLTMKALKFILVFLLGVVAGVVGLFFVLAFSDESQNVDTKPVTTAISVKQEACLMSAAEQARDIYNELAVRRGNIGTKMEFKRVSQKELAVEDAVSQKLYALAGSFMEPCIVYEEPVKLDRTVLADIR